MARSPTSRRSIASANATPREGIDLSVLTLADQVGACAAVLRPLQRHLAKPTFPILGPLVKPVMQEAFESLTSACGIADRLGEFRLAGAAHLANERRKKQGGGDRSAAVRPRPGRLRAFAATASQAGPAQHVSLHASGPVQPLVLGAQPTGCPTSLRVAWTFPWDEGKGWHSRFHPRGLRWRHHKNS